VRLLKEEKIKEIHDAIWKGIWLIELIDGDAHSGELGCMEREGALNCKNVGSMRFFKPSEAVRKGVVVTRWGTLDQLSGLIVFEGYLTTNNKAFFGEEKGVKSFVIWIIHSNMNVILGFVRPVNHTDLENVKGADG